MSWSRSVQSSSSGLGWSQQGVHLVVRGVSTLQSSPNILPEESGVAATGARPAQVGAPLQELPHAVVRGELVGWDLLQEQEDQNVLLLVKQTEAARGDRRMKEVALMPTSRWIYAQR